MKKLVFALLLCFGISMVNQGCSSGNFKSESYSLNDELETYTVLDENGDTLLGIRNIVGDSIVIPPSKEWYAASVILNIIEIVTTDKTSRYFTTDGTPLGDYPLNMFDTVEDDSTVFYHGRGDSLSVFYFPASGNIIETAHYYIGKKYVCLQTSAGFDFRTYEGNLLWSVPDDEFYLLKKQNAQPEKMYIAIVKNNKATIYTPEGKRLKEMKSNQWKRIMKRGKMILKIGNATLIDIPKSVPI